MNSVHTSQPKFQVWLAIVYFINTRYVTHTNADHVDHTNAGAAKIVFRLRNDISDKDAFAGTRWPSISDLYKMKLFNAYEQCAH